MLTETVKQLEREMREREDQLDESERSITSLTDVVMQLSSKLEDLEISYDELQTDYQDLYSFTVCGNDFIDLDMVYRSNTKASEALTQWVDTIWGNILDSDWTYFWSEDEPSLHIVETRYANDYFIVYFGQHEFFGAPSGVFLVSHHCWLDGVPIQ